MPSFLLPVDSVELDLPILVVPPKEVPGGIVRQERIAEAECMRPGRLEGVIGGGRVRTIGAHQGRIDQGVRLRVRVLVLVLSPGLVVVVLRCYCMSVLIHGMLHLLHLLRQRGAVLRGVEMGTSGSGSGSGRDSDSATGERRIACKLKYVVKVAAAVVVAGRR